jgi:hypothetical protein
LQREIASIRRMMAHGYGDWPVLSVQGGTCGVAR